MTTSKLSAYNTSTIEIRPLEIRDEAFATVNQHHFALQVAAKTNISSVMEAGINILHLFVKTYAFPERFRRGLADKDWCGRFELYVNGKLFGSYAQNGAVLLGNSKHNIATIELNIEQDPNALNVMKLVSRLQSVPGMTSANKTQVQYASPLIAFSDGMTIQTWKNPVGVNHVFVVDQNGSCCFAGYVGWIHADGLQKALESIRQEFYESI
ncbi:MAG: hypothetical protein KME27_22325 [Lyngbya sp. HA4199-MV5]|jgi:hypothetical protein|nr:hypothetical protein [Lyngbya sp. HA4199-MV5]